MATPARTPRWTDAGASAGDKAWENRGTEANIRTAIAAWEKDVKADPNDAATLVKLTRAEHLNGKLLE